MGRTLEARKIKGADAVAVIDEGKRVNLWPQTSSFAMSFLASLSTDPLYFTEVSDSKTHLTGWVIDSHAVNASNIMPMRETWTWALPAGERVISTHTSSVLTDKPIASYSRELNDWFLSKMAKLLDPAVLVVLTYNSRENAIKVNLVDQSTGSILHALTAPDAGEVDISLGAHVAFEENWLTVGYTVRNADEVVGGRLLSIEYYDQDPALERSLSNWFSKSLTPRADISSKDAKGRAKAILTRSKQVLAAHRSFIAPSDWTGISALGYSETLYNAADRALLVYTGSQEVAYVPRRLLDPRRPYAKGSPELARVGGKQSRIEADSTLAPWDPLLPNDPTRILSHGVAVLSPRRARSGSEKQQQQQQPPAPQLFSRRTSLESLTLVGILGGTDFLLTKVTTGGDFDLLSAGFNKVQLVATIAFLWAAYVVTKPLVRGRALKARWA